jgi:hypothetical protein
MWANFNSMPRLLKFLTAIAACCFAFLAMSLFPEGSFAINGQHVTFAQWWSSGAGPFASLTGVFGPIVAWSLAAKRQHARSGCLAFLIFVFVIPDLFFGSPGYAIFGAVVVAVAAYYLYRWPSVQVYFAP